MAELLISTVTNSAKKHSAKHRAHYHNYNIMFSGNDTLTNRHLQNIYSETVWLRGTTTFSKLGVQFGPWSRVLLPSYRQKIRQVYPVWCSRLHNHILFIKKLQKTWVVRPNFFGVRAPQPPMVAPMVWLEHHRSTGVVLEISEKAKHNNTAF